MPLATAGINVGQMAVIERVVGGETHGLKSGFLRSPQRAFRQEYGRERPMAHVPVGIQPNAFPRLRQCLIYSADSRKRNCQPGMNATAARPSFQ